MKGAPFSSEDRKLNAFCFVCCGLAGIFLAPLPNTNAVKVWVKCPMLQRISSPLVLLRLQLLPEDRHCGSVVEGEFSQLGLCAEVCLAGWEERGWVLTFAVLCGLQTLRDMNL